LPAFLPLAAPQALALLAGRRADHDGGALFVVPVLAVSFASCRCGTLSNLVAAPVSLALLLVSAAISVGLGLIPLVGSLLAWTATALAWLLDNWATLFAGLPGSDISVPAHPLWLSLLFYLLVLLACEWFKLRGQLKPRQVAALRIVLPAMALVLLSHWLWWVLVPAPSFTALALPGCEGYIWRPATGRTILLPAHRTNAATTRTRCSAPCAFAASTAARRVLAGPGAEGDALPGYEFASLFSENRCDRNTTCDGSATADTRRDCCWGSELPGALLCQGTQWPLRQLARSARNRQFSYWSSAIGCQGRRFSKLICGPRPLKSRIDCSTPMEATSSWTASHNVGAN
jgi:hypothetical protein